MYVGAGSDHTDRALEAVSIVKSKQICPNVMSPVVWSYEEVKDVWDKLVLRSWVEREGRRILYQEGELSAFIRVQNLLSFVKENVKDGNLENTVIFSGTIPVIGGEVLSGEGFEVEVPQPGERRFPAVQLPYRDTGLFATECLTFASGVGIDRNFTTEP